MADVGEPLNEIRERLLVQYFYCGMSRVAGTPGEVRSDGSLGPFGGAHCVQQANIPLGKIT